jgi:ESS family glutamate:Na+ symporter
MSKAEYRGYMNNTISVGALESFLIAIGVLFLGHLINSKFPIFKKYNIPEPIVGGLIVAFFDYGFTLQ